MAFLLKFPLRGLFVNDLNRGLPRNGLGQKILVRIGVRLQPQSCEVTLALRGNAPEPRTVHCGIEICRTADILVGVHAVIAVCLIQGTGTFPVAAADLALLIEEIAEPVILAAVVIDGLLHDSRNRELVAQVDNLFGTLDDPGKNALSGILIQVVAVVLDVALALDLGIERNHDKATPSAIIGRADLREMVGVKYQAVAGRKAEGVFVLFLRKDVIGGTELLDGGVVQPSAFLHLGGNEQKASIEEYKQWKASTIFEAVTKGLRLDVAMKNTGLPFMPLIPKHWGRSKVGRFSLFFNGDRTSRYPKPEEFVDEGIAFLNSSNINGDIVDTSSCKYISAEKYDSLSGAKIEVGDIVYCLRGSIGKCALNTHLVEGTVASSLATIRPMGINGKYLLYCLLSKVAQEQVQIYMNGTCAANLSAESVSSFNIPFPPFEEQDTIGQYCFEKSSYFNNLIEEKQRLIDDLEQYKRSLIYEAVTGKRKVM